MCSISSSEQLCLFIPSSFLVQFNSSYFTKFYVVKVIKLMYTPILVHIVVSFVPKSYMAFVKFLVLLLETASSIEKVTIVKKVVTLSECEFSWIWIRLEIWLPLPVRIPFCLDRLLVKFYSYKGSNAFFNSLVSWAWSLQIWLELGSGLVRPWPWRSWSASRFREVVVIVVQNHDCIAK